MEGQEARGQLARSDHGSEDDLTAVVNAATRDGNLLHLGGHGSSDEGRQHAACRLISHGEVANRLEARSAKKENESKAGASIALIDKRGSLFRQRPTISPHLTSPHLHSK